MPTLHQVVAAHAPLLIIDAASARLQVGAWFPDGRSEWQASDEEAGIGVFQCLQALPLSAVDARAFVFCEGPGSILGIRTVAMAIRAWCVLEPRPVFAYSSLGLVAHALNRPDVGIIADARRDAWHYFRLGGKVQRVPTTTLSGDLAMPTGFRNWTPLPPRVEMIAYSLPDLFGRIEGSDLFRPTENPDAFMHEAPAYVTWTPHIHRGPVPRA